MTHELMRTSDAFWATTRTNLLVPTFTHLKLLQKPEGPYLQYLELIADETLVKPSTGGGTSTGRPCGRRSTPRTRPLTRRSRRRCGDRGRAVDRDVLRSAQAHRDARLPARYKRLYTRRQRAGLVPVMDLVNYSRDCSTPINHHGRLSSCGRRLSYKVKSAGTTVDLKSTLDVLTQYGFFSTGLACETRRAAGSGPRSSLDNASMVPIIEGARDTILRRRRAVAVRFCCDLEQPPILRQRREALLGVIFWVDVEDPLASAACFGARACLADEGEVQARTGRSSLGHPINAEANVRRALRDGALAVVEELSSDTGPVVEYQREQLSKLAVRLA